MRIVVHDYSGHPGQAQLSRALARRGHVVVHQHCPSYTTGKGSLAPTPGDPAGLGFEACAMRGRFRRYSPLRRVGQEVRYGIRAGERVVAARPDVVVLSNVPLLAHALVAGRLRRRRIPMVFWQQDVYSTAIATAARRHLPVVGTLVGAVAERTERAVARASDAVVAISSAFLPTLTSWGVAEKTTVVPNWGPVTEVTTRPRRNPWSERTGLADVPVVLYAGTLGMKHDPALLAAAAEGLAVAAPAARLVVVSEGSGRQWLEDYKAAQGTDNLTLVDYQPYGDLPDMLAAADVLLTILEADASAFSVPSKTLTYLCAGRPVVAVLPADNAAAQVVRDSGGGVVVQPGDREGLVARLVELLSDDAGRARLGAAARRYAETHFSPDEAAVRFEAIMAGCTSAVTYPVGAAAL